VLATDIDLTWLTPATLAETAPVALPACARLEAATIRFTRGDLVRHGIATTPTSTRTWPRSPPASWISRNCR
jgi:hypothetical protein